MTKKKNQAESLCSLFMVLRRNALSWPHTFFDSMRGMEVVICASLNGFFESHLVVPVLTAVLHGSIRVQNKIFLTGFNELFIRLMIFLSRFNE